MLRVTEILWSLILITRLAPIAAMAGDSVFGSDDIPFRVKHSDRIIIAGEVDRLGDHGGFVVYRVTAADHLKWRADEGPGASPTGEALAAALQAGSESEAPDAEALRGAVLFLAGPLSDRERSVYGLGDVPGDPTYVLTESWKKPTDEDADNVGFESRLAALRSYLEIGVESPASWAERYYKNPDAYLRESAILALNRGNSVIEDPEVHALMGRVLSSDDVPEPTRQLVVDMLRVQGSGSRADWAAEPLADLAAREDASMTLRQDALQTLGFTDEGPRLLADLAARDDCSLMLRHDAVRVLGSTVEGPRLLADLAARGDSQIKEFLDSESRASPASSPAIPDRADRDRLRSLLLDPSRSEQRQAVERVATYTLTPELKSLLRDVLRDDRVDAITQRSLLKGVARHNSGTAAEFLAEIAGDSESNFSEETRRDAIVAIGSMAPDQRIQTLIELESTLVDETLREYARAYGHP